MGRGWRTLGLVVLLLIVPLWPASPVAADGRLQGGPPVTFEDVTHEPLLLPGTDPTRIHLTAEVGCRTEDASGGFWRATFSVPHIPPGLQADIQPTTRIWEHAPSQCQTAGGHRVTTSVYVAMGPGSRAFQPTTFPVALFLERHLRDGTSQGYGAYLANVTVTPGFLGLASVGHGSWPREVASGTVAEVTVEVLNRGNGPTRFQALVADPPGEQSDPLRSAPLELAPGERGKLTLAVPMPEVGPWSQERVRLEVLVEGISVDEHARPEVNTSRVNVEIRVAGVGAQLVPGPGTGLAALAVVLGSALARRTRTAW